MYNTNLIGNVSWSILADWLLWEGRKINVNHGLGFSWTVSGFYKRGLAWICKLLTFMSGQKVLRKLPYERSIGATKTVGEWPREERRAESSEDLAEGSSFSSWVQAERITTCAVNIGSSGWTWSMTRKEQVCSHTSLTIKVLFKK